MTASLATDTNYTVATGTGTFSILQTAFVVNSTVDPAGGTPASCFTPANGWNGFGCSLRDAIAAANLLPANTPSTITFGSLFATPQIISIGSTNALLPGSENLTITGPGIGLLTLTGAPNTVFLATSSTSTLTMSAMTVSGSGGINAISNVGTMSISGMVFSGNASLGFGGAIQNNGILTVDKSTFSGNLAIFGGAIASVGTGTSVTITNSTFTGNSCQGGLGGALYLVGPVASSLTNDTFTGNTATVGSAINANSTSTTTLNNVTIAGNLPSSGSALKASSAVTLHNSIVTDTSADVAATVCSVCTPDASDFVGGNALLSALGSYGGPTQTMLPLPGSGALLLDSTSTANKDQRGVTRAITGANSSDAGAVQSHYGITFTTQPALPGATTPAGTNFSAAVTLTENNASSSQ